MKARTVLSTSAALLLVGAAAVAAYRWYQPVVNAAPAEEIPTAQVKRGNVRITVTARGDLQGGNSEMLIAPMTGGREMIITYLRDPGETVEVGDVVVRFDTTEKDFALREAEADLAEAGQQVLQAGSENEAREEESRYALVHAKAEVRLAELEVKKNPLLAAITARQNELALEAARDRLRQLEHDLANRKETSRANIAIQEAARNKAQVKADTARRHIDAMTLKAKTKGYVAVQQNSFTNWSWWGMQLPIFQVGDNVRAGMAVAQIPDMQNWEVTARMGELDRGHLADGQPAEIEVAALPGRKFAGRIKNISGTTGPPWDRHFDCKLALENSGQELRHGMSARVTITTGTLDNALWLPSQALFESDGRTYVYAASGGGFSPVDVKLVRRSESQVVVTGLSEGKLVALASPDAMKSGKSAGSGVMKAIPKS